MRLYLVLNVIIIAIPLALTFAPRVYYYRKLKPLAFSILIVGSMFVIWDAVASGRGDWSFNNEYVHGFNIFGLPFEEILFFITVPYSCLFLYETFRTYIKETAFSINKHIYGILALLFFTGAIIFINRSYTATILLISAIIFVSARFCFKTIFVSNLYWLYILICTALFAVFNYFLTSLPVVTYAEGAIIGLRIASIPIEDFFYNFSLLSLYLIFYRFAEDKWGRRASP